MRRGRPVLFTYFTYFTNVTLLASLLPTLTTLYSPYRGYLIIGASRAVLQKTLATGDNLGEVTPGDE